jgi:hypothetical protein
VFFLINDQKFDIIKKKLYLALSFFCFCNYISKCLKLEDLGLWLNKKKETIKRNMLYFEYVII